MILVSRWLAIAAIVRRVFVVRICGREPRARISTMRGRKAAGSRRKKARAWTANAEQTAMRRMLDQGEKIIIALTEPVDAGSVLEWENYRSRAREICNKLQRKKRAGI